MAHPKPLQKKVRDLTYSDIGTHPVWTWADDEDESLVLPVEQYVPLPEDHDALFVACVFDLHDGTHISGVLAVSPIRRWVYLLDFPKSEGGFLHFSLHPELRNLVTREQLATWLQKSLDDIFLIRYHTPFVFHDGQHLVGEIE